MKTSKILILKSELNNNFYYDARTGNLWRRHKKKYTLLLSKDAGGYVNLAFKSTYYRAHQIVWMMFNDYLPEEIDHIDRNRRNNRINNLRASNRIENAQNMSKHNDNKSGIKGVYKHSQYDKWVVQINHKHIGVYDTLEQAVYARREAAKNLFGERYNELDYEVENEISI